MISLYKMNKARKTNKRDLFANIAIFLGTLLLLVSFGPLLLDELWYKLKTLRNQQYLYVDVNAPRIVNDGKSTPVQDSVFARYLSSKPVGLVPVNTDFSLIIEKIGVNAPVIEDVSVSDLAAYSEALKKGIAHAGVSDVPSEKPSNVYLFAHASLNFWELGRYATTFNLLRKLDNNDVIYVIYGGEVFQYHVVNKEIFTGWNTYPLTRAVVEPILTLQTCDPPGTTLNRLVVTAKLDSVSKY